MKQVKPPEPNPVVKLEIGVTKADAIAFMLKVADLYGFVVTQK